MGGRAGGDVAAARSNGGWAGACRPRPPPLPPPCPHSQASMHPTGGVHHCAWRLRRSVYRGALPCLEPRPSHLQLALARRHGLLTAVAGVRVAGPLAGSHMRLQGRQLGSCAAGAAGCWGGGAAAAGAAGRAGWGRLQRPVGAFAAAATTMPIGCWGVLRAWAGARWVVNECCWGCCCRARCCCVRCCRRGGLPINVAWARCADKAGRGGLLSRRTPRGAGAARPCCRLPDRSWADGARRLGLGGSRF